MRPPVDGEQESRARENSRPPLDEGKKSTCKGSQAPKLRRALFLPRKRAGRHLRRFAKCSDRVRRYRFRRCRSFPHRRRGRFVTSGSRPASSTTTRQARESSESDGVPFHRLLGLVEAPASPRPASRPAMTRSRPSRAPSPWPTVCRRGRARPPHHHWRRLRRECREELHAHADEKPFMDAERERPARLQCSTDEGLEPLHVDVGEGLDVEAALARLHLAERGGELLDRRLLRHEAVKDDRLSTRSEPARGTRRAFSPERRRTARTSRRARRTARTDRDRARSLPRETARRRSRRTRARGCRTRASPRTAGISTKAPRKTTASRASRATL